MATQTEEEEKTHTGASGGGTVGKGRTLSKINDLFQLGAEPFDFSTVVMSLNTSEESGDRDGAAHRGFWLLFPPSF